YGYIKNHKKTVKNGQTRTRERKSVQEPEAKVKTSSNAPYWLILTKNDTVEEKKAQGLMKFTLSVLSKEAQSSNHTDATLAIRMSYHLIQRSSIALQSL
ncbi:hypothetical protein Tco_1073362, partial [Tanacetum coccineum]